MILNEVHIEAHSEQARRETIIARQILGLINGERIIHTSSHFNIARDDMNHLIQVIDTHQGLRGLLKRISRANGFTRVEFTNGGTIISAARTNGGGRGFTADLLILDDADRRCTEEFMASALPMLYTSRNPQVMFIKTLRPVHDETV
ncbi:hypothetical protein ACH47B_13300 [Rhodococcus sp. NPDC019627]|uniref:hypothetical protein n=1 Tax=unclassified Rhodococcus (in: high G+C Gram-positive bacteria) TaxID=192944 RepID=UPI0033EA5831